MNEAWRRWSGGIAWPTLALVGGIVAGEALLWGAVLSGRLSAPMGALPAFLLAYLAFTPAHEAAHGNVGGTGRGRAWIDATAGRIAGLALLAPFPAFRAIHLRHHGATNDGERDPDGWVAGRDALDVGLRCLSIVPHYYAHYLGKMAYEAGASRAGIAETLLTAGGFWGALVLAGAAGFAEEALFLWVLPGFLASALLAFLFDWLPHVPHTTTARWHGTRVILAPLLPVGMLGQNYHLVHHLWPRVPFYRYGTVFWETAPLIAEKGGPVVDLRPRWWGWAGRTRAQGSSAEG